MPHVGREEERNGAYNHIMKRDAAALLKEALSLPAADRAAVAEALLTTLDEDADDTAAAGWKTEIERRIIELDEGKVATIPWQDVRRRLFERARDRALKRLRDGLNLEWRSGSREDLHRR